LLVHFAEFFEKPGLSRRPLSQGVKDALTPEDNKDLKNSNQAPLSATIIRKIAKQSLVSFPSHGALIHHEISQKSADLLSIATGLFSKQFALDVEHNSAHAHVTRKVMVSALLQNPRYHFSVTRLRTTEIFSRFIETNEFATRVAISDIKRPLRFPIEFVIPFPPGDPYEIDEKEVAKREIANADAVVNAIVTSHHAYWQTVLDCFKRTKYGNKTLRTPWIQYFEFPHIVFSDFLGDSNTGGFFQKGTWDFCFDRE
jgi:hypothetical protein